MNLESKVCSYYSFTRKILFSSFFKFSLFIQYIPTMVSLPFTHPSSPSTSPPIDPLLFHFSSEKSRPPRYINGHIITRCNSTRHNPLYQGCMKQHSRRKRVSRAGKRVRDTPLPSITVPQNPQVIQLQHISRRPSTNLCRFCDCCFSLCEPLGALLS